MAMVLRLAVSLVGAALTASLCQLYETTLRCRAAQLEGCYCLAVSFIGISVLS